MKTENMIRLILISLFASLVFFSLVSAAAAPQPQKGKKPTETATSIFEKILEAKSEKIVIETDLKKLVAEKNKGEYQPAKLVFGNETADWDIKVKARGKFRRRFCEFPPIKVKFSKKQLLAAGLDTLNEFKLVTHCADSEAGDQLLAREFLAYQLFEKLSPVGLRTRLVEVEYRDSEGDKSLTINRLAMILEDAEEIAARLGGHAIDGIFNHPTDSFQVMSMANMTLFNYMIGNTDWSIDANRNVELVRPTGGGKIVAIPYDFDFSGFVNASYATPASETGLANVRERFWMGENIAPEAVKRAARTFRRHKDELFETVYQFEKLPMEHREDLAAYLTTFFQKLDEFEDVPRNPMPKVADR